MVVVDANNMRKLFIITALVFMAGAAFSQIPVRVGLYVIRSSDTIYLRPNQFTTGGHLWNEIKSTNPLWFRADSVFKYTGGSQWWDGTTGLLPTTGAGTRMMYIPSYAALYGGLVQGTQYDTINYYSLTWGVNNACKGNTSAVFGAQNVLRPDAQTSLMFGQLNRYIAGKTSGWSLLGGESDSINSVSWSYVGGYGNYTASDYSFIHSLSSKITGGTASSILGGFSNRNYGAANSVILGGHALYLQAADSNVVLMNRQIIRHGWGKNLTEWQRRSGTILAYIDTGGVASFSGFSLGNSARFGNGLAYVTIDTTNAVRLYGDATAWEDTQVPALSITTGATAPSLTPGFAGSASLQTYYFQGGGAINDQCWFSVQLPHSYKENSNIIPHVHWSPTTDVASGNDTVVWELTYTWQSFNATFAGATTITCKSAGGANAQWDHVIAPFASITGTSKGISSIMVCRLRRLDSDGSDTYGTNAAFLGFDIHYEVDSFGSNTQTTK